MNEQEMVECVEEQMKAALREELLAIQSHNIGDHSGDVLRVLIKEIKFLFGYDDIMFKWEDHIDVLEHRESGDVWFRVRAVSDLGKRVCGYLNLRYVHFENDEPVDAVDFLFVDKNGISHITLKYGLSVLGLTK